MDGKVKSVINMAVLVIITKNIIKMVILDSSSILGSTDEGKVSVKGVVPVIIAKVGKVEEKLSITTLTIGLFSF